MGYVMWAAYLDVPLDKVEVTVEADYDAHGMLGIDPALPPGWTGLRYKTVLSSSAPDETVRAMVDQADKYSAILDDFRRPHDVLRELRIEHTPTSTT